MAAPDPWPRATEKLLPNALFDIADQYPNVLYAEYFTSSTDLAAGYRRVTYKELADGVTQLAWWIEENIGKPEKDDGSQTIVYFGMPDIRYGMLVFASVLVGYKMLFPSPRYGAEGIAKLIEMVGSEIMLLSSPAPPVHKEVLSHQSLKTHEIPSLDTLLSAVPQSRYPFTKTWESHRHEPLVCLHTSGTTGFPKPIVWPHTWASSFLKTTHFPKPAGMANEIFDIYRPTKRSFAPFPPFHASGVLLQVIFGVGTGCSNVYPPPAMTPSQTMDLGATALEYLASRGEKNVDWLCVPPPHAEYLASQPELLQRYAKYCDTAMYAGGDISTTAGNTIASELRFWCLIASTENAVWAPVFEISPHHGENGIEDWHYSRYHPNLNLRFEPVSDSDDGPICEAVITRNEPGSWTQPCFLIAAHEHKHEFHLEDLFIEHPTKKGMWKHHGRADDLLNFITTEKFHPTATERLLATDTNIEEVMMVGTRRPAASLIVRLKDGTRVEDIWKSIERVNEINPVYARVRKEMVLVVTEPFLRTDKGSVQKKGMLGRYEKELDGLYAGLRAEGMLEGKGVEVK